MSDTGATSGDVFAAGLFPLSPATHDQGLRWLFDLSTLLLLLFYLLMSGGKALREAHA